MTNIHSPNAYDFDTILRRVEEDVKTLACLEKEIICNLHSRIYVQCSNRSVSEELKNENLMSSLELKKSNYKSWLSPSPVAELSFMSGQIVNLASQIDGNYYCPFCPLRHLCELGLKIHLKQHHHTELDLLWNKKLGTFHFQCCPCCGAKFYLKRVCLKHFVTYHSELVLDSWSLFTSGNENSLCSFCLQDFHGMKTDSFIMHFLSKHSEEFENILFLSVKMNTHQNSIQTADSLESVSPCKDVPLLTRNFNKPVKRALHFSIPEAVVHVYKKTSTKPCGAELPESTQDDVNSGNDVDGFSLLLDDFILKISPSPKKKNQFWRKKRSSPKPKFTSTPLKRRCAIKQNLRTKFHLLFHSHFSPTSPNRPYRCGSCQLRFHHNHQLVYHVRSHFRFRMLPIFSCGLCPAQFYKNRFLLKHCAEQHLNCFTPLESMWGRSHFSSFMYHFLFYQFLPWCFFFRDFIVASYLHSFMCRLCNIY